MKKKILFILTICLLAILSCAALADVKISKDVFPDPIFRDYVRKFDTDGDGKLNTDEMNNVFNIYVPDMGIESLEGIQNFPMITYVYCENNKLTHLDLSGNPLLDTVHCQYNELYTLNVRNNTELLYLLCWSNNLTELDVSQNTKLIDLWCHENRILKLDVSMLPSLKQLLCTNNQISSLDVSKNKELTTLGCGANKLTEIDISNNRKLDHFECALCQLTKIDVSRQPDLRSFSCNGNHISTVDVSKCTILVDLVKTASRMRVYGDSDQFSRNGDDWAILDVDKGADVIAGDFVSKPLEHCGDDEVDDTVYTITMTTDGNGKAWADPESGPNPTQVILMFEPNPGYQFKEWQILSGDVQIYKHKLCLRTSDVEVKAIFEESKAEQRLIDLSDAEITVKDPVYTGKKLSPEVSVILQGKTLTAGDDYSIICKDKAIGSATLMVEGKGAYTGSVNVSFTVRPKSVSLVSVKSGKSKQLIVRWKKGSGITGYEIQYSLKKNFKNAEMVTVDKAKTTSVTIPDLKSKKKYYVRIRAYKTVNGENYYSEWSRAMNQKVK